MSFEAQITRISAVIKSRVNALVDRLREREKSLLKELEEILSKYKHEKEREAQSASELKKLIDFTQENITSEILRVCQDAMVETANKRLKEIEAELSSKHISFDSDSTLLDKISRFGEITVCNSIGSCLPVVDYKDKVRPVVSVGSEGSSEVSIFHLELYSTIKLIISMLQKRGTAGYRSLMKMECLLKFGDMDGPGRMKSPLYIAIYKEKVFVTHNQGGCVLVFDLKGNFIIQIGNTGSGEGQFDSPYGITVNEYNGDIYVCDSSNKRIQIFSENYSFKSQFGKETLQYPKDIQLTRDNIYVLSFLKPFLTIFNYNFTPVQNIISNSISNYLNCPFSFVIDGAGNIIISDYVLNSVFIFNQQGELLHSLKDSISQPIGVCIDSKGRIIVVCYNHILLIFFSYSNL